MFENIKKYGLFAALTMGSAPAFAVVDPAVTTAFTELGADLLTVGALVIVATVGVQVIKYVQAAII